MFSKILSFVPRTRRVGRETEIANRAEINARLGSIDSSVDLLMKSGLPKEAAWDIALQITGVPNIESVFGRLTSDDWANMAPALEKSETIAPAIRATSNASSEPLRDLLTKIIKGELESPGDAPRSAVELVNRLGKDDLEKFLRLRTVAWSECSYDWSTEYTTLFCLENELSFPGLLNHSEIRRLDELGLILFASVPFESKFLGPIAFKHLKFGERAISVTSIKEDAVLYLGHIALSTDGQYIIELYRDEPCEMLEGHFETVCNEFRNQEFMVSDVAIFK